MKQGLLWKTSERLKNQSGEYSPFEQEMGKSPDAEMDESLEIRLGKILTFGVGPYCFN